MSAIQTRKERERAGRHQLIIDTARQIAETDGWDAVTVRKLADRIEYSQPVLYSHFAGKDAIVSAVALEGFGELALAARRAREDASTPAAAVTAVAQGYLDFSRDKPALYDAMFSLRTELKFGPGAAQPMQDCFMELMLTFAPFAAPHNAETFTEVAWSALHGLATLDRGGRLRPDFRDARLEILVSQWIDPA